VDTCEQREEDEAHADGPHVDDYRVAADTNPRLGGGVGAAGRRWGAQRGEGVRAWVGAGEGMGSRGREGMPTRASGE